MSWSRWSKSWRNLLAVLCVKISWFYHSFDFGSNFTDLVTFFNIFFIFLKELVEMNIFAKTLPKITFFVQKIWGWCIFAHPPTHSPRWGFWRLPFQFTFLERVNFVLQKNIYLLHGCTKVTFELNRCVSVQYQHDLRTSCKRYK